MGGEGECHGLDSPGNSCGDRVSGIKMGLWSKSQKEKGGGGEQDRAKEPSDHLRTGKALEITLPVRRVPNLNSGPSWELAWNSGRSCWAIIWTTIVLENFPEPECVLSEHEKWSLLLSATVTWESQITWVCGFHQLWKKNLAIFLQIFCWSPSLSGFSCLVPQYLEQCQEPQHSWIRKTPHSPHWATHFLRTSTMVRLKLHISFLGLRWQSATNRWLETRMVYSFEVLNARSTESKCRQGHVLSKVLEEDSIFASSLFLVAAGNLWCSLANGLCLHGTFVPLCLCFCLHMVFSSRDVCV